MSGKNLVLKLNAKMLSANHIARFLNSKTQKDLKNYWRYKVDFLHAGTYLLKLQICDVILHEWGQACPGMPKEAIKTLRSQKLKEV